MAACLNKADAEQEETDPGAAPFGNFINYYTFNPPENRLSLIPTSLLQLLGFGPEEPMLILDVGCNSGELSVALYNHLVPEDQRRRIHLLGFDLDEGLIERAQQKNPLQNQITFIPLDITKNTEQLQDYLHLHDSSHFHLTLCLAVTMWVHLNHGDSGLQQLLSSLASISHFLLLEAQPWKCYRSAARRLRKLGRSDFDHFKMLEIKGDIAAYAKVHLVQHCGMEFSGTFGSTSWDRKLLLFKKRDSV